MQIAMVGAGYVGLVTGACLADLGHSVTCVDHDDLKIAGLRAGVMPIFEPGLGEMVARNVARARLSFDTQIGLALQNAQAVFIATGTPPRPDHGGADLSYLMGAVRHIAQSASRPVAVVIKSTVPPGTADQVERLMRAVRVDLEFPVISNPEFLREGSAIRDFLQPDRIVCGVDSPFARALLAEIYHPLTKNGVPLLFTGRRSAELIKHASNAFLAMKVSFINEVADLCEAVGADIGEIAKGVGLDHRIGASFLQAGPGYGGSCFPKDTAALLALANDHGVVLRSVEAAAAINHNRKAAMVRRIAQAIGDDIHGATVAVLGLTFKANTDDTRDSPALAIIDGLQRRGAKIRVYDPQGMKDEKGKPADVIAANDPYHCAEGADCLVLATEWDEFRTLELKYLRRVMRSPVIVDLRNLLDAAALKNAGFVLHPLGRPRTPQEAVVVALSPVRLEKMNGKMPMRQIEAS